MLKRCVSLACSMPLMAGLVASAAMAADKTFTLEEATIADIQGAMTAGALSAESLVQLYTDRIAAYDRTGPKVNTIILVNPKAKAEAAALDKERAAKGPRGPLHGIPVLLKDNIDAAGMPTTNGSAVMKGAVPPDDARITKALRDAGAVILGKAAMGEFAGGSYNSVIGQTVNPYNLKRNTGGSSGGSGAAIAANFAVLAIGTDTSTSVRGPASYNGIVGFRPTTGLVSRDGIAPKNLNFDTAGPMARTVTDMVQMLNVIAVRDPADAKNLTAWAEMEKRHPGSNGRVDFSQYLDADAYKGKRVGVLRDFFGGDPEIDVLAEAALAEMRKLGATTVDIKFDKEFVERHLGKGMRNMRDLSDYRFREDWEKYLATFQNPKLPKTVADFIKVYETEVNKSPLPVEDSVMRLLKTSLKHSTDEPEYKDFLANTMPKSTADKVALFDKNNVDVLVFPYVPTFAQPIKNPVATIDDPSFVKSDKAVPATLAGYGSEGLPSAVVPMGFGSQGLPMTIGFFGKPYEDAKVIAYAFAYEQATKRRKPSPLVPPLKGETINYKTP